MEVIRQMTANTSKTIKLGTRKSSLAMAQAEEVAAAIERHCSDIRVDICKIQTQGDRLVDRSLAKVGGKGLFLKEIQQALLNEEIDLAVHSLKDMPVECMQGLEICAVPKRKASEDVLISHNDMSLEALPWNAVVGTSSLRRKSQLLAYRPDLTIEPLRGNIHTRIEKLQQSDTLSAIVLAKAGLMRAGMENHISREISPEVIVPGVGQGALGLEVKSDREDLKKALAFLEDAKTRLEISAERQFLATLGGSCFVPVGALAEVRKDGNSLILSLTGVVARVDGSIVLKESLLRTLTGEGVNCTEHNHTAIGLGKDLGKKLIAQGASDIIRDAEEEVE